MRGTVDENMKKFTADLIINTASRRTTSLYSEVIAACERHGVVIAKTHRLSKETSLPSILSDILTRKPKLVIVGGGDGTISDVVDHLVGSSIEVAVLPLGTTNNFARSLNMPFSIDECIRHIKNRPARPVDLGKVEHEYFTNITGIGLSGIIAAQVKNTHKKYFGRLAYALVGIRYLLGHKPFIVTIKDIQGNFEVTKETHQLIVANGKYHAGRKIAQEAEVDNRELIIFSLGGRSKLSFVYHMLDFYIGRRRSIRHSSYFIGRHVTIETNRPQSVELDGEVKFTTPITVEVAPRAVMIRY